MLSASFELGLAAGGIIGLIACVLLYLIYSWSLKRMLGAFLADPDLLRDKEFIEYLAGKGIYPTEDE